MNHHGGAVDATTMLAITALAIGAGAYLVLAQGERRGPRGWPVWRAECFVLGAVAVVAGLVPALSPYQPGSFAGHMHTHLLVGMYGPLGLALGAPVTLALRTLPRPAARLLGRVLGSAPMGMLTHPVTALLLNAGGLYVVYCTPLFAAMAHTPALHHLVHLHVFLAGYLFAYSIGGQDPAPHRPSVPARLVVLGVAIAAHAVLAQLMYGGWVVDLPVPAEDRRAGADLMYFGGDIAELLLAFALVSTWRTGRARPSPILTADEYATANPTG